jgi:hypothetical protein
MTTQTNGVDDIPEEYCCPITREIMIDPVIMKDGVTYEREVIAAALARNPVSPISRKPLSMADAIPNRALKSMIERFLSMEIAVRAKLPANARMPELRFTARRGDKIEALKAKITELAGIPPEEQKLKLRGELLEDSDIVLYSGICQQACIDIECPEIQIFVKTNSTRTLVVRVFSFQTVLDLKHLIDEKIGLPPDVQALVWHSRPLDDKRRLSTYRITANSTIYVTGRLLGGAE